MAINFIPNDPLDGGVRLEAPIADPPGNLAGFNLFDRAPEGKHQPVTPPFLFWQCRQAALAALRAWEALDGPLAAWSQRQRLDLLQDAGKALNAFYDRQSLSFFHEQVNGTTFFSGASTDVVAHEAGHGLLDAIRPDFWYSNTFEVNAFHEGFADIVALITALADPQQRTRLIESGLGGTNFLEATAEELSHAIGLVFPGHNASAPRHALNDFKWKLFFTLPQEGGPGELIAEIHSFAQIISGCFYDTLRNIFAGRPQNADGLKEATETAGRLLIAAARTTPQTPRFFRAIGNEMLEADQQAHGGANEKAIRDAFAGHDIDLEGAQMAAMSTVLDAEAPALGAVGGIPDSCRQELIRRIGGDVTPPPATRARTFAGKQFVEVLNSRMVALDQVDPRLTGVVAPAVESAWLGWDQQSGRCAVLGPLPEAAKTAHEVQAFVYFLVQHDYIALPGPRAAPGTETPSHATDEITHEVQVEGGQRVLRRIRFFCRPSCR